MLHSGITVPVSGTHMYTYNNVGARNSSIEIGVETPAFRPVIYELDCKPMRWGPCSANHNLHGRIAAQARVAPKAARRKL